MIGWLDESYGRLEHDEDAVLPCAAWEPGDHVVVAIVASRAPGRSAWGGSRHSHDMKNILLFSIAAVALIVVFVVPQLKQSQRPRKFDDYFEKRYGVLGRTTDEILGHENLTNRFDVMGALRWRMGQKEDSRLTDTERRLLAAYWVEAEVNNGGFDQYFFNSAGDNAELAMAGLKDMGAVGAAALLERAMAVFPGGKPPVGRFKRQEVMEHIASQSKPVWSKCDDEFYKLTERISDLSLNYVKKKRTEIVLP